MPPPIRWPGGSGRGIGAIAWVVALLALMVLPSVWARRHAADRLPEFLWRSSRRRWSPGADRFGTAQRKSADRAGLPATNCSASSSELGFRRFDRLFGQADPCRGRDRSERTHHRRRAGRAPGADRPDRHSGRARHRGDRLGRGRCRRDRRGTAADPAGPDIVSGATVTVLVMGDSVIRAGRQAGAQRAARRPALGASAARQGGAATRAQDGRDP